MKWYREFIENAERVFSDAVNPSEAINASRSQGVSYIYISLVWIGIHWWREGSNAVGNVVAQHLSCF